MKKRRVLAMVLAVTLLVGSTPQSLLASELTENTVAESGDVDLFSSMENLTDAVEALEDIFTSDSNTGGGINL